MVSLHGYCKEIIRRSHSVVFVDDAGDGSAVGVTLMPLFSIRLPFAPAAVTPPFEKTDELNIPNIILE